MKKFIDAAKGLYARMRSAVTPVRQTGLDTRRLSSKAAMPDLFPQVGVKPSPFTMPLSFGKVWAIMLRALMRAGIGGYRRYSLRRTGRGVDRRADKLETSRTSWSRRYFDRYACV